MKLNTQCKFVVNQLMLACQCHFPFRYAELRFCVVSSVSLLFTDGHNWPVRVLLCLYLHTVL